MRDTEERIIDEAKAEVRKRLAHDEANWLVTRLGLAAVEFPQIVRKVFGFIFRDEWQSQTEALSVLQKRIAELDRQIAVINDRLRKAGLLVKQIDERTRAKPAQPQRR